MRSANSARAATEKLTKETGLQKSLCQPCPKNLPPRTKNELGPGRPRTRAYLEANPGRMQKREVRVSWAPSLSVAARALIANR